MNIRNDIILLRATAVLLVVLYHFNLLGITGGFLGVDVFFVISGFLMAKIIIPSMLNKTFNFKSFYISRFNRLAPALVFLIAVNFVILFILVLPSELRSFSKHAFSSLIAISNYIYSLEGGYFNQSYVLNYLLHTWSLSIEWQFFLIFPVLSFVLIKLFKSISPLYSIFLLFCIINTLLVIVIEFNYYNFLGRLWELLIGGIVFFVINKQKSNKSFISLRVTHYIIYSLVVVLLILACLVNDDTKWPGTTTFLVVIISAVIIYLGEDFNLPKNFDYLINWLAERSYSIYLWHWPIHLYFITYFNQSSLLAISLLLTTTLFFSELSYKFIETPLRKKKTSTFILNVSLFVLLLGICLGAYLTYGYANLRSFNTEVIIADKELKNSEPRRNICLTTSGDKSAQCIYPDYMDQFKTVLIGDSHASAVITALSGSDFGDEGVLLIAKAGCLLSFNQEKHIDSDCIKFTNKNIYPLLLSKKTYDIVISSRWGLYENKARRYTDFESADKIFDGFFQLVCELSEVHKVTVVSAIPEVDFLVPTRVAKNLHNKKEEDTVPLTKAIESSKVFREKLTRVADNCGFNIVEPVNYLCKNNQCKISINSRPIFYDDNHLSEYGNKFLIPMFNEMKRNIDER